MHRATTITFYSIQMSFITVQRVSLTFFKNPIFRDIGFQIEKGDRIGLIGPNGAGKTTLLRLIMGEISPDEGEISIAKGIRLGYLPQDIQGFSSGPLLPSIIDSIPKRVFLAKELSKAEQSLKISSQEIKQTKIAERLADIHQEIQQLELQYPRHEAEKILTGLGFKISDYNMPVSSFSGGWKMRAALASLLYKSPDLLLMDEPTNHLDIPSIRWLEQFLQGFNGAIILVSHDRDFLNRQINRVISLEPEGMSLYSGNYDFYIKAREEKKKSLEAKTRNQEQKIKEAQRFIVRFRSKASKARQAQSKIKLLKKMNLVEMQRDEKKIHFSFPEVTRSGRSVISIKGLSKGFDGKLLYKDINLSVLRGERVAIIGPNGSGKTTLLRMLAGEIDLNEGIIEMGHGVNMSYFAQHHSEMLNPQNTIIQEVYQAVPNETIGFIRGVLSAFLFSGGEVDKVINVLSGGERARVSLAKLLVDPGNLMLLDEPTNHLDISSSEKLTDSLSEYDGTLLFVSHNQSFINRLATKLWDIRDGEIIEYPGNLNEYYDHLARIEKEIENDPGKEKSLSEKPVYRVSDNTNKSRKEKKKEEAEKRKRIHDTMKPILTELDQLEEEITGLELIQKELEKKLANPEIIRDKGKTLSLIDEYNNVRHKLDKLFLKWEQCQGELESVKMNLGFP